MRRLQPKTKKILIATVAVLTAAGVIKGTLTGTVNQCVAMDLTSLGYETVQKETRPEVEKISLAKTAFIKDTTSDSAEISIPDWANRIAVVATRSSFPEKGAGSVVIKIKSDFFDGEKWLIGADVGGFATDGGNRNDDCGDIAPISFNDSGIPPGKGRKIIIHVITKENLDTTVSTYFKP